MTLLLACYVVAFSQVSGLNYSPPGGGLYYPFCMQSSAASFFTHHDHMKNMYQLWQCYLATLDTAGLKLGRQFKKLGIEREKAEQLVEATKYYMNRQEEMFESAVGMRESNQLAIIREAELPKIDMKQILFEEDEKDNLSSDMHDLDMRPGFEASPQPPKAVEEEEDEIRKSKAQDKETTPSEQCRDEPKEDEAMSEISDEQDYEKYVLGVESKSECLINGMVEAKSIKRKMERLNLNMYNVFLKDKRTGRDVFYAEANFYLTKVDRKTLSGKEK